MAAEAAQIAPDVCREAVRSIGKQGPAPANRRAHGTGRDFGVGGNSQGQRAGGAGASSGGPLLDVTGKRQQAAGDRKQAAEETQPVPPSQRIVVNIGTGEGNRQWALGNDTA